jgi:hypothetical protein
MENEPTFRQPKEFEFILLDPTGVELDRHVFQYIGGPGNRIIANINGHHHVFMIDGKYNYELGADPRPDVCYCGEVMKPMNDPNYICMNPFCDYYCKIRASIVDKPKNLLQENYLKVKQSLPEGMPPESICIDVDRDDVFVMQYHTLLHGKAQMNGDFLKNTEKWLEANEGRYTKLTNKKI